MSQRKLIKLHLGCGKRNIPGFINVDLINLPHIHHQRSVDNLKVFADNCAGLIYASHVLEYFDREEAVSVLHDWKRVLAPGGVLRIAVPHFNQLIKVYQNKGDLKTILGPLYGRIVIATQEGEKILYHKTTYDFKSLKILLESVGFKEVQTYNWKNTIHRYYDDQSQAYFPHMDKEHGILISLNIEATK